MHVKVSVFALVVIILLVTLAGAVQSGSNSQGKWQLHYAGPHDSLSNTCDLVVMNCDPRELVVEAPGAPGRYDIYVFGVSLRSIKQTSFGISCTGDFLFLGWTGCADTEIPSAGWPGCGESITLMWDSELLGPHIPLGILDVYVYGDRPWLCADVDQRVGYGEWCDGTVPEPRCDRTNDNWCFGCVAFGEYGYNACGHGECGYTPVPVKDSTWGRVKALYRHQ